MRLLVENFRGVERVEGEIGKLTVFVGKNNTGKSSVLTALSMLANLQGEVIFMEERDVLYAIRRGSEKARVVLDDRELELFRDEDIARKVAADLMESVDDEKVREKLVGVLSQGIFLTYRRREGKREEKGVVLPALPLAFRLKGEPFEYFEIFRPLSYHSVELDDVLTKAEMALQLEEFIKENGILEGFERFVGTSLKIGDRLIPVDLMGDGFKDLLGIMAYLSEGREIYLLDEPTAFFHPGYTALLVNILLREVEKGKRIFISTHSLDLLYAVLDMAERAPEKVQREVTFVRMVGSPTGSRGDVITFQEALEMREAFLADLRGV